MKSRPHSCIWRHRLQCMFTILVLSLVLSPQTVLSLTQMFVAHALPYMYAAYNAKLLKEAQKALAKREIKTPSIASEEASDTLDGDVDSAEEKIAVSSEDCARSRERYEQIKSDCSSADTSLSLEEDAENCYKTTSSGSWEASLATDEKNIEGSITVYSSSKEKEGISDSEDSPSSNINPKLW